MTQFYTLLVLNLIFSILSIYLINTLYSNNLIDKSKKDSLILLSVLIPIGGLVTIMLKYRRVVNHLARIKDLK